MTLAEIRTATITEKGQISIPSEMRKNKSFAVGQKVAILAFKNRIEVRPLNDLRRKMAAAIASERSLAKDWDSKEEDETWRDL